MSFFRSKLGNDMYFKELMDKWVKYEAYQDLTKKIQEKQVKFPGASSMATKVKKTYKRPPVFASGVLGPDIRYEPLVSCDYCNKDVDRENELFYTIGKEPARTDKLAGLDKQRILSYHAECFMEIAGEEFL